jgi:hypothetical protein
LQQIGVSWLLCAPGKADLPLVEYYLVAPLGKQDKVLPLAIVNRHQHCRSPEVFSSDSLYLTMTKHTLDLLLHDAVIIPVVRM